MRDRWDKATKWFRSQWWSLLLLALAVGLPVVKVWIDLAKMMLDLMRGSKTP